MKLRILPLAGLAACLAAAFGVALAAPLLNALARWALPAAAGCWLAGVLAAGLRRAWR